MSAWTKEYTLYSSWHETRETLGTVSTVLCAGEIESWGADGKGARARMPRLFEKILATNDVATDVRVEMVRSLILVDEAGMPTRRNAGSMVGYYDAEGFSSDDRQPEPQR